MTRQEILEHNVRIQAEHKANRERVEAEHRADVERRWQALGYTDNPPFAEKAKWLASISYQPPMDTGNDYEAKLMALPGTQRYENLRNYRGVVKDTGIE